MSWSDLREWLSVAADVAQVVVAVVAVQLAARANRISKDAHFVQHMVTELSKIASTSREIRAAYEALLLAHKTKTAKKDARNSWVEAREELGDSISDLVELYPDLSGVGDAWSALEDVEDSHAAGDSPEALPEVARKKAMKKYDASYENLKREIREAVARLRAGD